MLTNVRPSRVRRSIGEAAAPRLAIAEDLFKSVLTKERKRADRCKQPLVLLLVAFEGPYADSAFVWRPVIESLGTVTRESDVIGWFDRRGVIGTVLTEVRAFDETNVRALKGRIRLALAGRLDAQTAARCSIRIFVHPTAQGPADDAGWPAEPPKGFYAAAKRGLDVVASLTLLLVLSPLFLVIAALVKFTSSGPVFYEQVRIGQRMKPFKMLKFRTMRAGADHTLHREYVTWFIKSSGRALRPGATFKLTSDPRITPVGRFLRKTSLDELPQLWNVLEGRMSLVGPRPPLPYETEQYQPWHCRRVVEAKPGITGRWQVTGRSRPR